MEKGINVLSLFDGISCGQQALKELGIKVNNYFASEIKEDAIKVTQSNFPNTKQLGDVREVNVQELPKIDLILAGSPCQDFSRANKEQKGLEGSKSSLFFQFLRILEQTRKFNNPEVIFLLENVKMKKDQEELINEYVGMKPLFFESSNFVAAHRKRLYWTNIEGVTIEEPKNILLKDVITSGFVDRDKSLCLLESLSRPLRTPEKIARRYLKYGFWQVVFKDEETYIKLKKDYSQAKEGDVRYLNQEELEELQGLPKGYTNVLNRDKAAGVIGDGWTVPVIKHILSHHTFK